MPQMTVTTVVTDFKHLRFTVTFNISATSLQICVSVFRKLYSFLQITLTPLSVCVCVYVCIRISS